MSNQTKADEPVVAISLGGGRVAVDMAGGVRLELTVRVGRLGNPQVLEVEASRGVQLSAQACNSRLIKIEAKPGGRA